jgi:class 3 adenylate cyclase
LPEETAIELKRTGKSQPKRFDNVTVLFTDFVDFSKISEQFTPDALLEALGFYFGAFDEIISRYDLEKIKTIGDSYMCAGGLPLADKENSEKTVAAAIEMRDFILQCKQERMALGKPFFDCRIGIHTGSVIAGIVGSKKFAYDIWGDTVNTAARMQQRGEANRINVSGSTYELIKLQYQCHHRGKIEAKNKGLIDMYFVEKKR